MVVLAVAAVVAAMSVLAVVLVPYLGPRGEVFKLHHQAHGAS